MQPGQCNIHMQQGDTYSSVITWTTAASSDPTNRTPGTPVDVTGASATLGIYHGRTLALSVSSTSATANGSVLTLGGTAGTISILISADDSASLPPTCDGYSLVVTESDGSVTTLLSGAALVSEIL